MGLLDPEGNDMPLTLAGEEQGTDTTRVLELTEEEHVFEFTGVQSRPVPSLLRDFSAPVRVNYPWNRDQLMFLMSHDSDGFNRWDAGQRLAVDVIRELAGHAEAEVDPRLINACRTLLNDREADQALVAKMLQLPTEAYLIELTDQADVQIIHHARERVLKALASTLRDDLMACYERQRTSEEYRVTPEDVASRSLRNMSLAWLLHIGDEQARELALQQFRSATNMTDQSGALRALVNSPFSDDRDRVLDTFYQQWHQDPQVVEQWFSIQASSPIAGDLASVRRLLEHEAFDWKNPNKIRNVVGAFAGQNLAHFHAQDGSGYQFLAETIRRLDDSNPQIAARLCAPLTRWRKFAHVYSEGMRKALESVRDKDGLSRDVYEIVHKSLAD